MANKLTTEQFEYAYRRALEELRKKERKDKREKRNSYQPNKVISDINLEEEQVEEREIKLELSEKAEKVNLLLKKGLSPKECGQVLGCSRQAVLQVKNRYGLPR